MTAAVCAWAILLVLVAPSMAAETEVPTIQESVLIETAAKTTADAVAEEDNSGTTQDLLATLRGEIATYMDIYQISPEMPDNALAAAYFVLDSVEAKAAWDTAHTLMDKAAELSDKDTAALMADINTKLCLRFYDIIKQINAPMPTAYNQSYTADNLSIAVEGNDSEDYYSSSQSNNNSVTATVKTHTTKNTCGDTAYNQHTVSVTVTNNSSKRAILGFQWAITPCSSGHTVTLTVNGTAANGTSGSYSTGTYINAGAGVTLTLQSCSSCVNNSTLVLSEFSYTPEADQSKVTFLYDSSLGSITVAGNAVNSGHEEDVTTDGVAVTATANTGVIFLGWINEESCQRYSVNTSDTLTPGTDATIRAVFIESNSTQGWYLAGKTHLFSDLNKAAEYAKTSADSSVVLMNNATLPAGNYTIPAGVTFLVPFDESGTCYVEKPVAENATQTNPSPYRTLTMEDGAIITVNGIMSVSSKVYAGNAGQAATMPKGQYGHVDMKSGSLITVNGKLSVYGYITGSGSIVANKTASLYEAFQVMDFRGGQCTFNMNGGLSGLISGGNDGDVLPLSQYYVQNIEVPLTIHSGATETAYVALYMSSTVIDSAVAYIGSSNCMFNLTSGYVVKQYDKNNDRLQIDIYGDLDIESFFLQIKVSIASANIDSANYILPITNCMTVNLHSGSIDINSDMAMLPGSQINIGEGSTVSLASGKRFFLYDLAEWQGKGFLYGGGDTKAVQYVYGRTKTRTTDDLTDALITVAGTLDTSNGYLYTTQSGASIIGEEGGQVILRTDGTNTVTHQATQSGTDFTLVEIPVSPAQLLNANGNYVKTAEKGAGTYTYINGFWHKGTSCDGGTATCTAKAKCSTCGKEYGDLGKHTEVIDTATNPKWDAAGLTEGKHCSVCKTVIVKQQEIAAAKVGNEEYSILKEAINAANRSTPVTLLHNIDGDIPVNKAVTIHKGDYTAKIVADTGFTLSEDASAKTATVLIRIMATNIVAGDGLDIYFYVLKSALGSETGYYAEAVRTRQGAEDEAVRIEGNEYTTGGTTYVRFRYADIAAKEMTDTVTMSLRYSDGTQASNSYTESIKDYAIRTLDESDSSDNGNKLKTALMDMLNYGAAAQDYFGDYNIETLANAGSEVEKYASFATVNAPAVSNGLVEGDNLKAVSVSAKNKLMMTFYFANITQEMTAKISYEGLVEPIEIKGKDFFAYNSWYGVDVTGLPIADGRKLVTCEVYDGGTLVASASDSVEGYVARNGSGVLVLQQLMKFVDSAYAYFR